MKKNCKRLIKKNLKQKKQLKEKETRYIVKWRGYDIIVGLVKNTLCKNESILS